MYGLPRSLETLYPFRNEPRNYVALPCGRVMHFVDEGTEGIPIIMVHGNPSWSFLYRDAVKALRKDHRCIVPDHIGCGLSEKPEDYSYTLDQHIQNLKHLVDHLKLERFHLMVHDWGGPIGFGLALEDLSRVESLTIFNTSGFLDTKLCARIRLCRIPLFGALAIRGLNAFARGAVHMCTKKRLEKEVRDGFCFPYNNWQTRIATHRFVADIPLSSKHPSYERMRRIEAGLPELAQKPTLICWGGKDFCFTKHYYDGMCQRFPNAEAHYYEDAGHYLLEDAGEVILGRVKGFLGKLEPAECSGVVLV